MNYLHISLRLILSILCGGIIGIERESVNRPAGFRTHILVCVGSTLTMLVSIYIFELYGGRTNVDPARIAAQVVSGIGFLGAGTILREGATVRGLTTAASLWTVAAIGLAIGSGFYFAAGITTLLTFVTLISLAKLENYLINSKLSQEVILTILDRPGQIGKVGTVLGEMNVSIRNIKLQSIDEGKLQVVLDLRIPLKLRANDILLALANIDGIYNIECDNVSYSDEYVDDNN